MNYLAGDIEIFPRSLADRDSMTVTTDDELASLRLANAELRARMTAASRVLELIAKSPSDLQPVFGAIAESARELTGALYSGVVRLENGLLTIAALCGWQGEALATINRSYPRPAARDNPLAVAIIDGEAQNIADILTSGADYTHELQAISGYRSMLVVPMMREQNAIGAICVLSREVNVFQHSHVDLLKTFANQAVIAIENARLFNETKESLARQTATADVLKVIASSPSTLQPVFDAIAGRSKALIGGHSTVVVRYIDGMMQLASFTLVSPEADATVRKMFPRSPTAGDPPEQILRGEIAQTADAESESEMMRNAARARGWRSRLMVPLKDDSGVIGWISITRKEPGGFADKDVELLRTFADQAVIAIQNVKLFEEVQARTRDLQESLQQQTATSEVLQVISSSPGDLTPVFDKLLENATHVCGAEFGSMVLVEDDSARQAALYNASPAFAAARTNKVFRPHPLGAMAAAIRTKQAVQDADVRTAPAYLERLPHMIELAELGGARTVVVVPMLRDNEVIGTIAIYRQEVRPFADKQIELLSNFAKQAVIAIENARLLTETREALERQTATAEILKVINSSPGNLVPVFETILEKAHSLCAVAHGTLLLYDGEKFRGVASRGLSEAFVALLRLGFVPGPNLPHRRLLEGARFAQVTDWAEIDDPLARAALDAGLRTSLQIPLRREGKLLGYIAASRSEVKLFTEKEIALLESFAAQAVIAMENARLLDELRERTDEVAELNRGLEARVAAQVEELGRVGRLKRFLAPQLAELIVSQGDEKILESHRREIVVVFCDLRGYTAFTETAEPEEVLDFLREYHGTLGPLVSQFEGTLDQFSGDGIMVFFNDPVPIPDPAERAVKMAVAMREAASTLIAVWRERGRELGFGAGIAQGYATLGQIGFSERSGYTAIGTVCNVAARLCGEAKDGQILLSQHVNVTLKGSVATEQIGALTLKGLTHPVVAYNVPLTAGQPALRVIDGGSH